jgi:predicted Co/Zn/Cd cation transporter (cation efflux family)
MNYGRIALAAVAATVVDAVYGFLVYGLLLSSQFGRFPGVYRSNDVGPSYLPLMFAGILIAMCAVAAIYAKGYEGGAGAAEGIRFGVLFGVFAAAFYAGVSYATLNIGRRMACDLAVAGFVEWVIVGAAIGLAYKPSGIAARKPAVGV